MNVLECFSGTGSISKICKELDWNCLSLDKDLPADINIDILEWDYKQIPNDTFDIVWCSPPCELWSRLQNTWIGRKRKDGTIMTADIITERINKYGKPLVDKTLEIIEYFKQGNPNLIYFIENPATSRMKDYIKMDSIVVSYCKYADWGYRKDTRIWSNVKGFTPKICKKDCNSMIQQQHKLTADGGGDKRRQHKVMLDKVGDGNQHNKPKDLKFLGKGTNRIDRYRIPPELIRELFICCI